MSRMRAGLTLLLATLAFVSLRVDATCEGNSCPHQHDAATTAGLLGGPLHASNGPNMCSGKNSYPKVGKMKPVLVPTPVVDVRWAGTSAEEDKYVFALTRGNDGLMGGHLFRSDAQGKGDTWDDRTNEMTDAMKGETPDLVGVVNIHFLATHPAHMLFQGPGHYHWISNDYGRTYEPIETPGRTLGYGAEIRIHPRKPDWLLSRVRRNECLKEETASSKWCAFDLFVSKDFGRHWQNLTASSGGRVASFWDFDWGANVEGSERSFNDETILATVYESAAHMKGPYPGWDKDMQFVVSHDFFKSSHRKLVPCGNQFEVLGKQIYLAAPSDCPLNYDGSKRSKGSATRGTNSVQLLVSTDEALTFEEACIPIRFLDKGYNLVRTHDGTGAFVIVDHDEEDAIQANAPISNIYSAGFNTSLYTLSLRRNYRRGFVTDFARIEGLPGAYLANQLDGKIFDNPGLMPSKTAYSDFVQTKVSFSGGAHWQDLAQPESFRYPECNACKNSKNCQLHLHGPSSWHYGADARPSFYSHKSAPGIVMATGNTGDYLDFAADVTCTWLSHDGGATWRDVLNFPGIYEFGDHGGIVVMAPHQVTAPSDVVYFSLNQGGCWYTVQLEEAIDIQNIRVEPKAQSDTFVVHGQACRVSDAHPTCTHNKPGQMPGGRIYTIDITDLMGDDLQRCKSSDYDTWSPPRKGQCLLGRNITMNRRKPDSICFNSYDFKADNKVTPCNCSEADIECEFGYEWTGTECVAVPHVEANQCSTLAKRKYVESITHRRLVHEDQCTGISRVIPDTNGMGVPNESSKKHRYSGVGHFFVFLLLAGVITAAFGVWWSRFASEIQKAMIEEILIALWTSTRDLAMTAVEWAREKVSGGSERRDAEAAYFQPLAGGEGMSLDDFSHADDARSPPVFQ